MLPYHKISLIISLWMSTMIVHLVDYVYFLHQCMLFYFFFNLSLPLKIIYHWLNLDAPVDWRNNNYSATKYK